MSRAAKSDNWRSGSSSGSTSTSNQVSSPSPTADKALRSARSGRSVSVRDYGSDGLIPIKAEDAQAHYPPSSCVFVAK